MDEVTRSLITKWHMTPDEAGRREDELRLHFPYDRRHFPDLCEEQAIEFSGGQRGESR